MIDLHTHILPNIDDGAYDAEEAMKMTEALYKQNIHTAVCTPHFDPSQITMQDFIDNRSRAMTLIGKSKIHLIPASETLFHDYLLHYPDLSELCIKNTRYLLIELPFCKKWDKKLFQKLERMIAYYDIIPIIAHIERYPAVKRKMKWIKRLRTLGCVIQLNTASVLNKKTKRRVFRYIKKGYIDVLGSDCHNMKNRFPVFQAAVDKIRDRFGIYCINQLEYNAELIAEGKELRRKRIFMIE